MPRVRMSFSPVRRRMPARPNPGVQRLPQAVRCNDALGPLEKWHRVRPKDLVDRYNHELMLERLRQDDAVEWIAMVLW